jgi:4'-phosphopantetheinyl transferase EntD
MPPIGRRAITRVRHARIHHDPFSHGGGVIDVVLPGEACAETFEDLVDELLFPEEEAAISRAVHKRQNEFRTVRACARRAFAALGMERPPLIPDTHGAPAWPDGIVGSMTHCAGYRAAVVGRRGHVASLGLDAEPDEPLPDGVLSAIALPAEKALVDALSRAHPATSWDRLLFSAKETVYKTWYPLTGQWLGFEDAVIEVTPDDATFAATLLVPGPIVAGRMVTEISGRWTADRGLLVTGARLQASGRRQKGFG